jgi:hypothetical protein
MNTYEKTGWGQDSSCPQSEDETPIKPFRVTLLYKSAQQLPGNQTRAKKVGAGVILPRKVTSSAPTCPHRKKAPHREALFAGDKEQLRAGNNVELFAVYKGAAGAAKLDSDLSQPAVYVDFHARNIRGIL